ncbi:MAG: hypothetical protein AAGF95_20515 [Chloroflexota bacterium]
MNPSASRVELQIWREAGQDGVWRCRVLGPETLQVVRLGDEAALSSYVTSQLNLLFEMSDIDTQDEAES